MANGTGNGKGERTALLVVRNSFEHDARVLRAARTVAALGFDTTVLAVVSESEPRTAVELDGIHVRRVGPASRVERSLYGRLRGAARAPAASSSSSGGGGGSAAQRLPGPLRRAARLLSTLAYYRRAIAFVRAMRPDLVHCNDYNTMWIGVAARYLVGSVVVYDSHELWPDRNLRPEPRWWLMLCEALFVRVADRVVMTSPAHAEVLARRYRVPEPVVVRNIPASSPAALEGAANEPPQVAAYVGGLLRHRGLEQTIEALASVPHARLRLIGPVAADYRAELERLASSLGVLERVELVGAVPPTKVVEALAGADAGVALFQPICLSHRLVLPNKLFEYAIAGLPVLASDLPMISRFVEEHGLGVTVDSQDADSVAAGLAEVLEPERNRVFREGARRAAASLDWEREQELLAGVYREALSGAVSWRA